MKPAVLLVAISGLAGCAGQSVTTPNTDILAALNQIATFSQADLAAAQTDAIAHADTIAAVCYPALSLFVTQLQVQLQPTPTSTAGIFVGFQRSRDLVKLSQGHLPDYLIIGCGPLALDATMDVLGLLKRFGQFAAVPAPLPVIVTPHPSSIAPTPTEPTGVRPRPMPLVRTQIGSATPGNVVCEPTCRLR